MTVNKTESSLSSSIAGGVDHHHHHNNHQNAGHLKIDMSNVTQRKALSANLQSFVNRLATPKKKETTPTVSTSSHLPTQQAHLSSSIMIGGGGSHQRASTPQPSSGNSDLDRPSDSSSNSNSNHNNNVASSGISSAASSAVSIAKKVDLSYKYLRRQ